MTRYVVSLTETVTADSEEEALEVFERDVITGGNYSYNDFEIEEEEN